MGELLSRRVLTVKKFETRSLVNDGTVGVERRRNPDETAAKETAVQLGPDDDAGGRGAESAESAGQMPANEQKEQDDDSATQLNVSENGPHNDDEIDVQRIDFHDVVKKNKQLNSQCLTSNHLYEKIWKKRKKIKNKKIKKCVSIK